MDLVTAYLCARILAADSPECVDVPCTGTNLICHTCVREPQQQLTIDIAPREGWTCVKLQTLKGVKIVPRTTDYYDLGVFGEQ